MKKVFINLRNWFSKFFKKDAPAPALKMKPPKKTTGRKVNYEVDCKLFIEGKQVGYFPLTVRSFSKQHVQKMIEEGVSLEATNIRTARIKK